MTLRIVPFSAQHLPAAAQLVSMQYQAMQSQVGCLPAQYRDPACLLPILQELTRQHPGVAALAGRELVGFMAAWRLPDFYGAPAAFSPELANAARLADRQEIYETLYTSMAETWVNEGIRTHLVSVFPNDRATLDTLSWLGFGLLAADALRPCTPIAAPLPPCDIRRASPGDAALLARLDNALDAHISASPVYLDQGPKHSVGEVRSWLADPHSAFWIARRGRRALGFIGLGPASRDACQVIVDPGTTSISAAYVIPSARSQGIAAALLDRALDWARSQGYTRCAVDFEPMNPLARRFWLRCFQPVSYTLCRRLF